MGKVLELFTGFATAPGATLTAVTPAAGNTATIRQARSDSKIQLLQAWAANQAAGYVRIRSPQMHDGENGIRLDVTVSDVKPLLPDQFMQGLFSQDQLVIEISGSAVAGDIEQMSMLIKYDDLLGAEGRFIDVPTLMNRMKHLYALNNSLTLGAAGGYSGEEAINAEYDQWKANVDYALLGYLVDAECCSVRWRGADTSNYGVGGPGDPSGRDFTRSWFVNLARQYNEPMIPVFNAANKEGILIDGATDENATAVNVTSIFAELTPGPLIP